MMQDCNKCILKMAAASELTRLKKENEKLLQEQDSMFMLLDLFLDAVKLWGQQHGVIETEENSNNSTINKTNDSPNEDKKSAMSKRMTTLLAAFNNSI